MGRENVMPESSMKMPPRDDPRAPAREGQEETPRPSGVFRNDGAGIPGGRMAGTGRRGTGTAGGRRRERDGESENG